MSTPEAIELLVEAHGGRAEISLKCMATVIQVQQLLSDISRHKQKPSAITEVTHWCDENKGLCKVIHLQPEPVIVLTILKLDADYLPLRSFLQEETRFLNCLPYVWLLGTGISFP